MHDNETTPLNPAGIALIVSPLIALGLKLLTIGWVLAPLMLAAILIVAGYILQVIIACQGFLSSKKLFGARGKTATAMAWITSLASIGVGLFLPDGSDAYYGSTFQKWLGAYGPNAREVHQATDVWGDYVALALIAIWIVSYIWLVVLWGRAVSRRNAQRTRKTN